MPPGPRYAVAPGQDGRNGGYRPRFPPVVTALADIPALALTEAEASGLRHGQAISLVTLMGRIPGNAEPSGGLVRAMAGSRVVGLARLQDGWMKPERLL